jgi:hypothetical protein
MSLLSNIFHPKVTSAETLAKSSPPNYLMIGVGAAAVVLIVGYLVLR